MDGVVGGDVAGVQGDHHIEVGGVVVAHIPLLVVHALQPQLGDDALAQLDQVIAQLDTGDARVAPHRVAQPVVHGEGQVALARAEIDHVQGLAIGQRRLRHGRREHLEEFVDLLPLARHGRDELALRVGDAQLAQEGAREIEQAVLVAVVGLSRFGGPTRLSGGGTGELAHAHAGLALLADGQLHLFGGREQVGVAEGARAQPLTEQAQAFVRRQVLGDVLGGKAQQEAQVRLAAQLDGAHHDALQALALLLDGGHTALVGHQQHLLAAALGQGLARERGETLQRGGVGIGRTGIGAGRRGLGHGGHVGGHRVGAGAVRHCARAPVLPLTPQQASQARAAWPR